MELADLCLKHLTAKIIISELGCWEWQGCKTLGYGVKILAGKSYRVHRLVAHLCLGADISNPEKMVLHHCDNRACCNPAHLYIGTARDNANDRKIRGRNNSPFGIRNSHAKLTEVEVLELRTLMHFGFMPNILGPLYGIHPNYLYKIKNNTRRREG